MSNEKKIVRKKEMTWEERVKSKQLRVTRTRIANMVARKPEIKKVCCICGSTDAQILHNKVNPYIITFICKDCRNDEEKLNLAEKKRFDIRSQMNKSKLSVKNFTDADIKQIVDEYLNSLSSIGAYCEEKGISRHQFNGIVKRYAALFNIPTIKKTIDAHTNKINRVKLSECANERNNF